MSEITEVSQKKRKLQDGPEIEIDVSAPEPVSKKALRKAKKNKGDDGDDEKPKSSKSSKPESKEAETEGKRSKYGIWIGNLSFTVTSEELRMFFTVNSDIHESDITRIHLPKGPERFGRSQNKGFAYVDFKDKKSLQEAIGLSEQLMAGRRVLIKDANSYEGRPEKSETQENAAAKSGHPPSKRVFVGNLSFDVTKENLEENFAKCGTVTNVHMATFQDTGKCKGYAWVEFEELAAAEAAVRGFMLIKEDDGEEDSSDSGSDSDSASEKKKKSKKLKPRMQRIWVNQLMGRRMRMEFAEEASVRYKKRFGKDAEKKDEPAITEVDGESRERPRYNKKKPDPIDESRYSKETVQKLSGAIVEAQGQKTTFD
ncbi:Nucleotide-binding alpha-beta plait [Penicillium concentricum]|uniref:Nucleotide-binding alpha-beta plait n=1 Tax=Penicillium concentricum TaxID=293559 RepID=A0A9W9S522_9EURO|nr:Nucleotide-binding alpha-beta plait [Penicillium concentricum]KAJ5372171.1 Nucleotide-binding alpha-beta plait [Penicillium concentricum]